MRRLVSRDSPRSLLDLLTRDAVGAEASHRGGGKGVIALKYDGEQFRQNGRSIDAAALTALSRNWTTTWLPNSSTKRVFPQPESRNDQYHAGVTLWDVNRGHPLLRAPYNESIIARQLLRTTSPEAV